VAWQGSADYQAVQSLGLVQVNNNKHPFTFVSSPPSKIKSVVWAKTMLPKKPNLESYMLAVE